MSCSGLALTTLTSSGSLSSLRGSNAAKGGLRQIVARLTPKVRWAHRRKAPSVSVEPVHSLSSSNLRPFQRAASWGPSGRVGVLISIGAGLDSSGWAESQGERAIAAAHAHGVGADRRWI